MVQGKAPPLRSRSNALGLRIAGFYPALFVEKGRDRELKQILSGTQNAMYVLVCCVPEKEFPERGEPQVRGRCLEQRAMRPATSSGARGASVKIIHTWMCA